MHPLLKIVPFVKKQLSFCQCRFARPRLAVDCVVMIGNLPAPQEVKENSYSKSLTIIIQGFTQREKAF